VFDSQATQLKIGGWSKTQSVMHLRNLTIVVANKPIKSMFQNQSFQKFEFNKT
jgi:hypothetical protein